MEILGRQQRVGFGDVKLKQHVGDFGAVPIRSCNEYVARSRTQLAIAESLASICTFDGMRWSSNLVQHMNWCNRNQAARHEAEDAARRKELAACQVKSK